ncbi:hypothetical protein GKZ89_06035 [Bacillus mangrovi]|uniref:Uncharacterized protein n=1 Tax=Metabacillus mangrovi TaxID=1491830 RepID=A0A7X2V4B9_9BACI|nr:hypothetical protein [Metabacillus mangrovi]MTH52964.1 hypothetical protein [Metabacillus mangrovi]
MNFTSWSFIWFLLAGLAIWIPVFLLIPIKMRSEGKWVITAASFLLALLYFGAAQIMPVWQAVLITAMLLGMCGYFLHQKGNHLIAVQERAEDESPSFEQSYFKSLEDSSFSAGEDDPEREEADQKPGQDESTFNEGPEQWEADWFEEEKKDEEQPEPQIVGADDESELERIQDEEIHHAAAAEDEEFDFERMQLSESESDSEVESPAQDLESRDFLNELSEQTEASEPSAEEDWYETEEEAEEEAVPLEKEQMEPSITMEEREVFESWLDEDLLHEEELNDEGEEDSIQPENVKAGENDADIAIVDEREEAQHEPEGVEDSFGHDDEEAEEFPPPEETEASIFEGQKSMPDDLLEAVREQLLVLRENSSGHDFKAVMNDVIIQSTGAREYFVFVQLYLSYLAEAGEETEFSNLYTEASEHLSNYPYLTEQLSWIQQHKEIY